jgi:hypothetical protein
MNKMWLGFADAKPSEAIQKHSLPGLAVAVVFILNQVEAVLPVPVKQYKDYKPGQKDKRARELAEWLIMQKQRGLLSLRVNSPPLCGVKCKDERVHPQKP